MVSPCNVASKVRNEPSPANRFTPSRAALSIVRRPEAAAAAVICYERLQRPENVPGGVLRWLDYRSSEWPNAVKILRHKTGATVWHPLEDVMDGALVKFHRKQKQSWRSGHAAVSQ